VSDRHHPRQRAIYCFPGKKGGDAIELVSHIKGLSQKDAALLMSGEKVQGTVPVQNGSVPVPPNEKGQLKPLDYRSSRYSGCLSK
jgi:DNA primase